MPDGTAGINDVGHIALAILVSGGQDRLVGTRATEIPLRQGKLTHVQRSAGFVFIRERESRPINVLGLAEVERSDVGPAVLVRPDGYIAWAGDSSDHLGWMTTLQSWLGTGVRDRASA